MNKETLHWNEHWLDIQLNTETMNPKESISVEYEEENKYVFICRNCDFNRMNN
jgi:hypothetical protein